MLLRIQIRARDLYFCKLFRPNELYCLLARQKARNEASAAQYF